MKRKNNNTKPPISPAKYIQSRSRSLPMHECWVNTIWKETQMANVIVSRKHSNGNITMAVYLVDLLCMGVKDTFYMFNVPAFEFDDFKSRFKETEGEITQIDYPLAHNIIFAGVDYATEIGLQQCKEFDKITQYLLEEDNDKIELIDIECGKNGMPCIIKGSQNSREADHLYHHLCGTIGPENFIFEDIEVDDFEEEDWNEEDVMDSLWYQDSIDLEDIIYKNPIKERHNDVSRLNELNNIEDKLGEAPANFVEVTERLFYNHFGYEKIDESRERVFNFFDLNVENQSIPKELLGFDPVKHKGKLKAVEEVNEKMMTGHVDLLETINQHPDIPYFKHLFIMQLEFIQKSKEEEGEDPSEGLNDNIEEVLDGFISLHPDYILLKILKEKYQILKEEKSQFIEELFYNDEPVSDLYGKRTSMHTVEFTSIVRTLFECMIAKEDVLGIDSLRHFIQSEYPELGASLNDIIVANMLFKSQVCQLHYMNEE